MSEPSPGPWELQRIAENWHGYPNWSTFAIRSAGNHCIAVVGEVDRATEDHNGANGVLMSAAHDLLKACKGLLTLSMATDCTSQNMIADARAAIAKATRPVYQRGDQVQSIECMWQGRVTGFLVSNGVEMLECHHVSGGQIELDDKRWFDPRDVRLVESTSNDT